MKISSKLWIEAVAECIKAIKAVQLNYWKISGKIRLKIASLDLLITHLVTYIFC